ncbi:conserved hypothetical protein [uncultured Dysgonomonas sp.]|uniref:Uncharacterized protein n=1 Tax=uncultured Dysgonomonas sp. TaxID=206096 RepID=A0A212J0C3_9BACT|nr:helix-turn-helix domain-containing protein [uncultured Dysgonomonas sp.]SBV92912.1 conserved hypothetical protein [uncultured Dysgonomonas sp.]
MRFIELSNFEIEALKERFGNHKNSVVQKRLRALELSSQYKSMKEIAEELNISRTTLYHFFEAWDKVEYEDKPDALFIKEGRGAKPKLESVKDELPILAEKYNRNIKKILQVLEDEYDIKVCSLTLRKYLKKTNI